mmetsp:Transcript_38745/g.37085  ORF Transcript_38745/g.37085 Transcript_38745/m.37085 type:complete len:196 (-) Transcript_38745:1051-1638(-)
MPPFLELIATSFGLIHFMFYLLQQGFLLLEVFELLLISFDHIDVRILVLDVILDAHHVILNGIRLTFEHFDLFISEVVANAGAFQMVQVASFLLSESLPTGLYLILLIPVEKISELFLLSPVLVPILLDPTLDLLALIFKLRFLLDSILHLLLCLGFFIFDRLQVPLQLVEVGLERIQLCLVVASLLVNHLHLCQ